MKQDCVPTLVETAETEQRAASHRKRKADETGAFPQKLVLVATVISVTAGVLLYFWHG